MSLSLTSGLATPGQGWGEQPAASSWDMTGALRQHSGQASSLWAAEQKLSSNVGTSEPQRGRELPSGPSSVPAFGRMDARFCMATKETFPLRPDGKEMIHCHICNRKRAARTPPQIKSRGSTGRPRCSGPLSFYTA